MAVQNFGIPWVAWHRWRQSLHEELAQEDDEDAAEPGNVHPAPAVAEGDDKLSLWVVALEAYALPNQMQEYSLLILQSLLLHGGLTHQQLLQTIPFTGLIQHGQQPHGCRSGPPAGRR